ncbi:hypothetical protein PENSUB_9729 [Penicillium subrubescens]|uniref:Uncharacterized protein n=1 Tax=Penicillium subrubescens TaxID=1316194 RepID=A0A1Q5TC57_9EURO|nr:hypothetical protein PENSUB_9729 [Penicillium subrubescens]
MQWLVGRMMQHRPRSRACAVFSLLTPHHWAGLSKIHRLGVEEPERPKIHNNWAPWYPRQGNRDPFWDAGAV